MRNLSLFLRYWLNWTSNILKFINAIRILMIIDNLPRPDPHMMPTNGFILVFWTNKYYGKNITFKNYEFMSHLLWKLLYMYIVYIFLLPMASWYFQSWYIVFFLNLVS